MKNTLRLLAASLAIALCCGQTASPQSLHDPLLERMVGTWVLRGEIAHKVVTHSVNVKWALAHQYIEIHETSDSKAPDGSPEYDAIVYIGWDPDLHQYSCLWLDSTGGNGLAGWAFGHAAKEPGKLAFLFADQRGEPSVRNTLSYEAGTDSWRWKIENFNRGQTSQFANVTLSRK